MEELFKHKLTNVTTYNIYLAFCLPPCKTRKRNVVLHVPGIVFGRGELGMDCDKSMFCKNNTQKLIKLQFHDTPYQTQISPLARV